MNKKIIMFSLLIMFSLVLVGCTNKKVEKTKLDDYICGDLSMLELEEKQVDESLQSNAHKETIEYYKTNVTEKNLKIYNSISELILALNSNKIDFFIATVDVARYLSAMNDNIDFVNNENGYNYYSMATIKENQELADKLSKAIEELKSDGTIEKIANDTMINCDFTKPLQIVEMPKIEGAETITVAVTGDIPPMDYVSSEGIPAGFNVALLSEISKKIGMNIEIKQIEANSRIIEMTTGNVDAVFWIKTTDGDKRANDENLVLTDYYYKTNLACVIKKEIKEAFKKVHDEVFNIGM